MSNPVDAFIPIWIADYVADTMNFATLHHGAYFLLLLAYWRKGGPLPDDDEQLAAITKMSVKEWRKIRALISTNFRVGKGVWFQKRCEEELEIARDNKKRADNRTAAATEARKTATKKPRRRVKTDPDVHRNDQRNEKRDVHRNDQRNDEKTPPKTRKKNNVTFTPSPSPSPSPVVSKIEAAKAALSAAEAANPGSGVMLAPNLVEKAVDAYNAVADQANWPLCQTVTEKRKRAIKARLVDLRGMLGWQSMLERASRSSFLLGLTERGPGHENWRCDLDFLIRPDTHAKLMEGKYDDREGHRVARRTRGTDALLEGLAIAAGRSDFSDD